MAIKPLHDNVIVKPLNKEEKTEGGIILPDTVDKEKPEKGEVIAVGPGKILENGQRQTMEVAVGNQVIFTKYSPNEVKINNETFLILSESDILAVVEDGLNASMAENPTEGRPSMSGQF